MFCKAQSAKKQLFFCAAILDPFQKKCSHLRPLLSITFPQGFQNSINFGHLTLGRGKKRRLNGTAKSKQTPPHTDKSTYRKHRPRGPMLWKQLLNSEQKYLCMLCHTFEYLMTLFHSLVFLVYLYILVQSFFLHTFAYYFLFLRNFGYFCILMHHHKSSHRGIMFPS